MEVDSLYTADITRVLPIDGEFTAVQERVYQVVLEAADAGFAVAKPGAKFIDPQGKGNPQLGLLKIESTNGTLTITAYTGSAYVVTIPGSINGLPR